MQYFFFMCANYYIQICSTTYQVKNFVNSCTNHYHSGASTLNKDIEKLVLLELAISINQGRCLQRQCGGRLFRHVGCSDKDNGWCVLFSRSPCLAVTVHNLRVTGVFVNQCTYCEYMVKGITWYMLMPLSVFSVLQQNLFEERN